MSDFRKKMRRNAREIIPLKLISVSAVALLIGIGAAAAQGGSARQTEHGIEKKKDNELLTPIRPLPRKVGETSWPEPKPEAQREANERKAAPVRETTGQSMSAQSNKADQPNNTAANNPANNAPQPAQNNQAATNQPQPAQNASRSLQLRRTTPRRRHSLRKTPRRMRLRPITRSPISRTRSSRPAEQHAAGQSQPDHASIRLGTDASGKVAINEDQEQQLAKALRRARPVEVNVGVQIGNPAPRGVRLAAVSADIVQVLPQFRGYSYFATAEQVYIVDPAANRVVAMVPVKLTATVKRDAPSRTTVGSAPAQPTAQPEPNPAPAHTATVTTAAPEPRGKRSTRGGDELAGVEAAIEREVQRRGLRSRDRRDRGSASRPAGADAALAALVCRGRSVRGFSSPRRAGAPDWRALCSGT